MRIKALNKDDQNRLKVRKFEMYFRKALNYTESVI